MHDTNQDVSTSSGKLERVKSRYVLGIVVLVSISLYSIVLNQRILAIFTPRTSLHNDLLLKYSSFDGHWKQPSDSSFHENDDNHDDHSDDTTSTDEEEISSDNTNQRHNSNTINNTTDIIYSIKNMTLTEWRKYRQSITGSFFEEGTISGKLLENADAKGPIMDFAIVGFPKCGTTTMEANLAYLAPMPDNQDICTPVHQTVYYSYVNWPKQFSLNSYPNGTEKILRGTKCPAFVSGDWLKDWSLYLPQTKLIIGIRHPILWFQSFWNMQLLNGQLRYAENEITRKPDPYMITKSCFGKGCRNGCPNRQLFCTNRARFHMNLAKLGKTSLSPEERELLSPDFPDGGMNLQSNNIKNYIFLYEQEELNEEYVWKELAAFLEVDHIPHDRYRSSHGKSKSIHETDFCEDQYDSFRAKMMPQSYELSVWLKDYFLPVAMNESRPDVIVPNATRFGELVEMYKYDPCGKLVRMEDGTYNVHNSSLNLYHE